MIKAILFDLDGTLLDIDMDKFIKNYFQRLCDHLQGFVDPQTFAQNLWASTGAMVENNNPKLTNQEAFLQHFYTWMEHPHEQVWPLIDQFYEQIFPTLQEDSSPFPEILELFAYLNKLDLKLVLATNPIFPRSAILHRLKWSQLHPDDFALITTYENMHYTKPNPKYYLEIAAMINVLPQNCLMVGNDYELDIKPAAKIGMKTFYVDANCTNPDFTKACGNVSHILPYIRMLTGDEEKEQIEAKS
ncbi:MAG: HAD family hydrolase [Firmicutes bacterium]|nr:HAD family hydrolase [Bacillota bacterium]